MHFDFNVNFIFQVFEIVYKTKPNLHKSTIKMAQRKWKNTVLGILYYYLFKRHYLNIYSG